jgi:hypothetical protein
MKKLFITAMVLAIAFITISVAAAQNETGPHGGRIEKTGGFKIEFVETYASIDTYLLDMESNTLSNAGVCCSLKFVFLDNTHTDYDMISMGKEGFALGSFPRDYYSCAVTFTIHERSVTAMFENRNIMAVYK